MSTTFPANSRYHGFGTLTHELPDGREVVYLERRFIPQVDAHVVQSLYTVVSGDRTDLVAWRTLGDPELSWRLADGNGAMRLRDVTDDSRIAKRIAVPLPRSDR